LTRHFNRRAEIDKRRELRNAATNAERQLWGHLRARQLGVKFRRQHGVDAVVLDFYAPRAKLAIEVDGDSHFEPEALAHDRQRTQHLRQFGIAVMRFTNAVIYENIEGVLESIREAVERRTSPGAPSLVRRGPEETSSGAPSSRGGRSKVGEE